MQGWGWGSLPPVAAGKLATDDDRILQVSPVSPNVSEDGKQSLRDRRFALEQDVAKLRKKHAQEVNLRRALERALQRPLGVLPRIPSYLPAKIQKLLAEVAVLEEEVIRLEDHVVYLRQDLTHQSLESSTRGSSPQVNNIPKSRPLKEPIKQPSINRKPKIPEPPPDLKDPSVSKLFQSFKAKDVLLEVLPDAIRKSSSKAQPSTRKPPANEVLTKLQGLQQPWKPTGTTGKSNIFKQFNSLGWNDNKQLSSLSKQPSTSSPRSGTAFNVNSNMSLGWNDRQQLLSPSKFSISSPRSSSRNGLPFRGSTTQVWEKENMQSNAAKLSARSPGASKLSSSVDEFSNVNRKSLFGSKAIHGASASASSPSKTLSISHVKETESTEPNQLSEELVKCLANIYSKLARLTPNSASRNSAVSSRSSAQSFGFRKGAKVKAPDSNNDGMQIIDFYGVCKDSNIRDIGPYQHVQEITVDTIDNNGVAGCAALYRKLSGLVEYLRVVDLQGLTHHHKLAFWINTYNACMMNAFLEHGIPSSPSKVVALMRKAVVNVGGYLLNALTIEHFILRLPCRPKNVRTSPWRHFQRAEAMPAMAFLKNVGMEEIIERSAYGLDWHEPLVTFALCCGSRSSPALRVYTASGVESELEKAKKEYLLAAIGVNIHKKIFMPKLLEWYMRDFAKDVEALLEWVCDQLPNPLHEAVLDTLIHPKEGILLHSIEVMPYDFNFRYGQTRPFYIPALVGALMQALQERREPRDITVVVPSGTVQLEESNSIGSPKPSCIQQYTEPNQKLFNSLGAWPRR